MGSQTLLQTLPGIFTPLSLHSCILAEIVIINLKSQCLVLAEKTLVLSSCKVLHKFTICHPTLHMYMYCTSVKVQLTPKIFFRLYKSFCLFDHRCENIIALAIFVNFL